MAGYATNSYTIQVVTLPAGTVTIKLHSAISGLTVPSVATLRIDGPMVERVDARELGIADPPTMRFAYTEDYSTYSEGFWFKVLQSEAEIHVLLGNVFFFWGRIQPSEADLEEVSLVSGNIVRVGAFEAISNVIALKDVTIAALDAEVGSHLTTSHNGYEFVSLKALVASMLKLAYNQTYGITDVDLDGFDFGFTSKISFSYPETNWADWYIWRENLRNGTDNEHSQNWYQTYPDCFELLKGIARSLGCVVRYWYDEANTTHKLTLVYRHTSYWDVSGEMPTAPSESVFHPATDMTTQLTYAYRRRNVYGTGLGSVLDAQWKQSYCTKGVLAEGDPSPNLPGTEIGLEFDAFGGYALTRSPDYDTYGEYAAAIYQIGAAGSSNEHPSLYTHFWSWKKNALRFAIGEALGTGGYPENAARYLYDFFGVQRREYERTYRGLEYTDGLENSMLLMKRVLINDGRAETVKYDCESAQFTAGGAWATVTTNVDSKVGTYSNKIAIDATATIDAVLATATVSSEDWSGYRGLRFWIKASTTTTPDQLRILGYGSGVFLFACPLPRLYANTWYHVFTRFGIAPTGTVTVEDCEDAWTAGTNVTASADTGAKVGTYSAKLAVDAAASAGAVIGYEDFSSTDYSEKNRWAFWIKSSVDTAAGDLQFLIDDTSGCVSPLETLNIPALAAGEWLRVELAPVARYNLYSVLSVGIKMVTDLGAFDLYIDDVVAYVNDEDSGPMGTVTSIQIFQSADLGAFDLYIDDVKLSNYGEYKAYEVSKDLNTAELRVRWVEA